MATKLNNITGQYHSYVEDQVLTHYQLNETIDYFDDQNRMQNVFLSGTGIVCGFQVSTNADYDAVKITQGTGITTDGDLIKLKKPLINEMAQSVKQKLFTIDFPNIVYKSYKLFDSDKANYDHFLDESNNLIKLWELLPEKTSGTPLESGETLLTSFVNLKDYVVLLYLENYSKDASLCSTIDCSNQGGEEVFNLRVLLVSKLNANSIIGSTAAPKDKLYSKYNYFSKYVSLPELGLKKVIPSFNTTKTKTQIKQLFNAVVSDTAFKTSLKDNISKMLTSLNFTSEAATISNGITTLFNIDSSNIPSDIHYKYDALHDIVATYKELKDLFIQLGAECNPNLASFPKHLLLGIVEDANYYKEYRHHFYKAPILDNQNQTYKNFECLVHRLIAIVSKYNASANAIKITPSKVFGKLGSKSVPYYYNVDVPFLYAWDFEKTNIFMHKSNFSYHTINLLSDDFITTPLKYSLDNYDFYRIEGYLNDSIDDVRNLLNTQKKLYGLDFDFQIIDIIENSADLKILMNNNPSWEHKAGVKKGGTLILLKEGTSFITDFTVDYKIASEDGMGCCIINECLYPWISSLKYINNLSRSLKGTPSNIKAMPTHYNLNIRRYSINGVNLISAPVVIRVPLRDVFLRRLHVVMEQINTQFPTGLVFDFIEEEKKVKIMKLEKDKFEFEVQDITQTNTSPVYKFTETGVTRNGKAYRASGITCSILNAHNQDIYKKIHSNYDPINKDDDDFGRFDEDWRKWEILRNKLREHQLISMYKRYITTLNDFENIPANDPDKKVLSVLRDIREAIIKADPRLGINTTTQTTNFYIGGDWTNGNWVNSTMAKHYLANMNNTNDDIVLFMKLRKKLHNEDKTSKFIIHIESTLNINLNLLTGVFNLYASQAEFYLQKPTVGNFIKIT